MAHYLKFTYDEINDLLTNVKACNDINELVDGIKKEFGKEAYEDFGDEYVKRFLNYLVQLKEYGTQDLLKILKDIRFTDPEKLLGHLNQLNEYDNIDKLLEYINELEDYENLKFIVDLVKSIGNIGIENVRRIIDLFNAVSIDDDQIIIALEDIIGSVKTLIESEDELKNFLEIIKISSEYDIRRIVEDIKKIEEYDADIEVLLENLKTLKEYDNIDELLTMIKKYDMNGIFESLNALQPHISNVKNITKFLEILANSNCNVSEVVELIHTLDVYNLSQFLECLNEHNFEKILEVLDKLDGTNVLTTLEGLEKHNVNFLLENLEKYDNVRRNLINILHDGDVDEIPQILVDLKSIKDKLLSSGVQNFEQILDYFKELNTYKNMDDVLELSKLLNEEEMKMSELAKTIKNLDLTNTNELINLLNKNGLELEDIINVVNISNELIEFSKIRDVEKLTNNLTKVQNKINDKLVANIEKISELPSIGDAIHKISNTDVNDTIKTLSKLDLYSENIKTILTFLDALEKENYSPTNLKDILETVELFDITAFLESVEKYDFSKILETLKLFGTSGELVSMLERLKTYDIKGILKTLEDLAGTGNSNKDVVNETLEALKDIIRNLNVFDYMGALNRIQEFSDNIVDVETLLTSLNRIKDFDIDRLIQAIITVESCNNDIELLLYYISEFDSYNNLKQILSNVAKLNSYRNMDNLLGNLQTFDSYSKEMPTMLKSLSTLRGYNTDMPEILNNLEEFDSFNGVIDVILEFLNAIADSGYDLVSLKDTLHDLELFKFIELIKKFKVQDLLDKLDKTDLNNILNQIANGDGEILKALLEGIRNLKLDNAKVTDLLHLLHNISAYDFEGFGSLVTQSQMETLKVEINKLLEDLKNQIPGEIEIPKIDTSKFATKAELENIKKYIQSIETEINTAAKGYKLYQITTQGDHRVKLSSSHAIQKIDVTVQMVTVRLTIELPTAPAGTEINLLLDTKTGIEVTNFVCQSGQTVLYENNCSFYSPRPEIRYRFKLIFDGRHWFVDGDEFGPSRSN